MHSTLSSVAVGPLGNRPFTRLIGLVLIVLGLFAGLVDTAGASRASDNGLISDSKYESPAFGYRVEWGAAWEAQSGATRSTSAYDVLVLESWGASIEVYGVASDDDPEDVLDLMRANGVPTTRIACDKIDVDWLAEWTVVDRGEEDGAAYTLLYGTPAETEAGWYMEARGTEDAAGDPVIVVISLIVKSKRLADSIGYATDEIELDGFPIFLASDEVNLQSADSGRRLDLAAGEDGDDPADRPASCVDGDERDADDEDRDGAGQGSRDRKRPDENGLIGDDAYRSPTFGYEVAWSGDWLADDARVGTSSDQLYLANADNSAQIWLMGLATDEALDEVRDEFAIGFVSQVSEDSELLDRGRANGAYWATFEIDFGDGGIVLAYIEAREIEPAEPGEPAIVTVTIFFAVEPLFDELIADATAHVELEGAPILISYE